MIIIGIDPGKDGGIVRITDDLRVLYACRLTIENLKSLDLDADIIAIEDVHWLPRDTPATAWTLARTVGWLDLWKHGKDIQLVTSDAWQAWAWKGLYRRRPTKEITAEAALKWFPDAGLKTYVRAAALIAGYAVQKINLP